MEQPKVNKASINIQEWIDQQYPSQDDKFFAEELHLDDANLEGELDLKEFVRLWQIFISPQINETKITFKNKPREAKICFYQAQKVLIVNFP